MGTTLFQRLAAQISRTRPRNLGLITGASLMGAVFALGSAISDTMAARPEAVAAGMRLTFAVAVALVVVALAIASGSHVLSRRGVLP